MKTILRTLILLGTLPEALAFGKCWSMNELPPTFCVELQVSEVTSAGECIVKGTAHHYSVPRADLQNLKSAERLKSDEALVVKLDRKDCKSVTAGASLVGILQAVCHDKGGTKSFDYVLHDNGKHLPLPAGASGFVSCE